MTENDKDGITGPHLSQEEIAKLLWKYMYNDIAMLGMPAPLIWSDRVTIPAPVITKKNVDKKKKGKPNGK